MSNTPQHTPGPWIVDDGDYGPQIIASEPYADWVVETGRVSADDLCWSPIATFDSDNALADATLAASAPALLSALRRLVGEMEVGSLDERETERVMAEAYQAISSATGGAS